MALPPLLLGKGSRRATVQKKDGTGKHSRKAKAYLREREASPNGTTCLLEQNVFTASLFESNITNSWQETNVAVESIKQLAEQRRKEVVKGLTSMADENKRREMAQAEGEDSRKLHVHYVIHASAQEALTPEQHTATCISRTT